MFSNTCCGEEERELRRRRNLMEMIMRGREVEMYSLMIRRRCVCLGINENKPYKQYCVCIVYVCGVDWLGATMLMPCIG